METARQNDADGDARRQSVAEYWDREAASYDTHFDHAIGSLTEQHAWDRVFDLVTGGRQQLVVLDVGTGTGFLALALAARGHTVTGTDLSPAMIEQASGHARDRGLDVTFQIGDAEQPEFEDSTFDLIISRHVFWALSDKTAVLESWSRLLRPGGCVAILDGDWCSSAADDAGGRESVTADVICRLLEERGLRRVQYDVLADLSAALTERALQEKHPLPEFDRYLVSGWREVQPTMP